MTKLLYFGKEQDDREQRKNKEMEGTQMHHMDPSASEEITLQSPLGTIIYQSLLPKPPERTAVCSLPVLTFF